MPSFLIEKNASDYKNEEKILVKFKFKNNSKVNLNGSKKMYSAMYVNGINIVTNIPVGIATPASNKPIDNVANSEKIVICTILETTLRSHLIFICPQLL